MASTSSTSNGSFYVSEKDLARLQTCQKLRALEATVRHDESLRTDNGQGIGRVIEDTDALINRVKDPETGLLDARLFGAIAGFHLSMVERISISERRFSNAEFVTRLSDVMDTTVDEGILQGNVAKWISYGQASKVLFHRPPALCYLYGSLPTASDDEEEGEGRKGAAKKKAPSAAALQHKTKEAPTKVSMRLQDQGNEDNVEKLVVRVHEQFLRACKKRGSNKMGFFDFVLDPDSFGQTVENIFHVSFLVKERKVSLVECGEDGLPELVSLRDKGGRGGKGGVGGAGGRGDNNGDDSAAAEPAEQIIMSLNMKEWREIVDALGIKEAVIKHEPAAGGVGDKSRKKVK